MASRRKQLTKKIHDVISATVESDETNQQQQTELPKKMTKKERQKNNRKYRKRNEKSSQRFRFRKSNRVKRYVI